MRLRDIAINNLKVRKTKMLFLTLGIVLGVCTIVSLYVITATMQAQVRAQFEEMGVRVLVTPYSDKLSLSYNGVTVASGVSYEAHYLPQSVITTAEAMVSAIGGQVAPKLLNPGKVEGRHVLLAGVDFDKELKLKRWWRITGQVPGQSEAILLGSDVAAALQKAPGEKVEVNGRLFTVTGILSPTGREDDKLAFIGLGTAQQVFGMNGKISFLELTLPAGSIEAGNNEADLLSLLSSRLPGTKVARVKDQAEARKEVADRFAKFSLLVSMVVFFIGCLIVGTTMMASVNERTQEIGIFRAMGFRKSHIIRIILTEAALVSGFGGITGYILGVAVANIAMPFMTQMKVFLRWDLPLGLAVIFLTVAVGTISSLYPALAAAGLDPAEALRVN